MAKSRGGARNSSGGGYKNQIPSESVDRSDLLPSGEESRAVARRSIISSEQRDEREPLPVPENAARLLPNNAGLQLGTPHCSTGATVNVERHPDLPPAPRVYDIAPCIVPDPPMLDSEESAERHAQLLANWYSGAVEQATGKKCWAFARGPACKSKHFKTLKAAARLFIEHDIAPAAWIAFSFSVWEQHSDDAEPPIGWVFGASRIEERRGWFHSVASRYGGGVQMYVPAAMELMRAHVALRLAVRRARPMTSEELVAIVERMLPLQKREALARKASAEAEQKRAELACDIANGKWVW
jgi:hypothetical protein